MHCGRLKVAVVGPQSTARSGLLSDYAGGQWCYGPSNKHPWSQQEYCIPSIAEGIAAANTGGTTTVGAGVTTCNDDNPTPKCKMGVSAWNTTTAADGIASALQIANASDAVVRRSGSVHHENLAWNNLLVISRVQT